MRRQQGVCDRDDEVVVVVAAAGPVQQVRVAPGVLFVGMVPQHFQAAGRLGKNQKAAVTHPETGPAGPRGMLCSIARSLMVAGQYRAAGWRRLGRGRRRRAG